MSRLALSENCLAITNPNRIRGFLGILQGLLLATILWECRESLQSATELLTEFANGTLDAKEVVADPQSWAAALRLVFGVAAGLVGLLAILRGLQLQLIFFVPTRVPRDLHQQTLAQLFQDRLIGTYREPSTLFQRILGSCSRRFRYLTPIAKQLAAEIGTGLMRCTVLTVILVSADFFQGAIERAAGRELPIFLPTTVLAILWICLGIQIVILVSLSLTSPSAEVAERRLDVVDAPHPTNLFLHVEECLGSQRVGNFNNRSYESLTARPRLQTSRHQEVHEFAFSVAQETQPLPVTRWFQPAGMIAGIASVVLCVFAFRLLLTRLPDLIETLQPGIPAVTRMTLGIVAAFVAASLALKQAARFSFWQRTICNTFRFRSSVFCVQSTGTFTVSNIGVGDGHGGTLQSSRSVVQSTGHINCYASQLITECYGLDGARVLLSSNITNEFEDRLQDLLIQMQQYHKGENVLPGIDIGRGGLPQIVQGNLAIANHTDRPTHEQGRLPESAVDDFRDCPQCAEKIRHEALICRFCRHELHASSQAE